MTKRDLSVLVCRFLAVYLIATVLIKLPEWVSYAVALREEVAGLVFYAGVLLVQLAVGIVLWFFARSIGTRMAGPESSEVKVAAMGVRDLVIVASVGVGIYLLADGIPGLVEFLTKSMIFSAASDWRDLWQTETVRSEVLTLIGKLLVAGAGLFLVLGCRRVAGFFESREQNAAVAVNSEE
jgi:hypothetical protein